MIRGKSLIVAGCAGLIVLSGCSSQEPGTPVASGGSTSTGKTTTAPPTGSSTSSASDIQPCDLLSPSDVSGLGMASGKPKEVVGEPTCLYLASGKFSLIVGISKKGIDNLAGQSVDVGTHQAVQLLNSEWGGCVVVLKISATSSAIVAVNPSNGDASGGCPQAVSTAKIIDPKLP
jgi:uncharacterized protein DUF3558